MNLQSWILIIALLLLAILQLKERKFTIRSLIIPIAILGYFSYEYIEPVPFKGINGWILTISIIGGIVFGILSYLSTKLYVRDGIKFVKCTLPYLFLWIINVGSKVFLAEYITKWNPTKSIHFIIKHHINPNVISTSFMYFTIAMIVVRLICIYIKFYSLNSNNKNLLIA